MANYDTNRILFGADIAGTMVFAMEGASAGINAQGQGSVTGAWLQAAVEG